MSAARPLRDLLGQLARVVDGLDDASYSRLPPEGGGGIGSHVRHCLDHVEELLSGARQGELNYDRRERGSVVERDRGAALAAIARLDRALDDLAPEALDDPITVTSLLSPQGPPERTRSTLGRELAYVVSHTTHHNALIAWLVRATGTKVPERFGYAAATLAWLGETRCAP